MLDHAFEQAVERELASIHLSALVDTLDGVQRSGQQVAAGQGSCILLIAQRLNLCIVWEGRPPRLEDQSQWFVVLIAGQECPMIQGKHG